MRILLLIFPGGVPRCRPPEAAVLGEEAAARGAKEVRHGVAEVGRRPGGLRTSIQGLPGHPRGAEAVTRHEEIQGRTKNQVWGALFCNPFSSSPISIGTRPWRLR